MSQPDKSARWTRQALLADMRQELLAPVNGILAYAELLLGEALCQELEEMVPDLGRIRTSATTLYHLADRLLEFGPEEGAHDEGDIAAAQSKIRHDIRNPLNAIKGYAEMLLEDAEDLGAEDLVPDLTKLLDEANRLLGEIEARTTGRVVLVSSPAPGQGSSTVSLNVAIAAARAGRRVMLIDADPSPHGISRFLSSGNTPGLSDVAAGTATLAEATRMWTVDDGAAFPMLPSGTDLSDVEALAGLLVADALDTVSERADLIVIDVPPILWSEATPELGRHADGTILVLSDTADAGVVSDAIAQLDAACLCSWRPASGRRSWRLVPRPRRSSCGPNRSPAAPWSCSATWRRSMPPHGWSFPAPPGMPGGCISCLRFLTWACSSSPCAWISGCWDKFMEVKIGRAHV